MGSSRTETFGGEVLRQGLPLVRGLYRCHPALLLIAVIHSQALILIRRLGHDLTYGDFMELTNSSTEPLAATRRSQSRIHSA